MTAEEKLPTLEAIWQTLSANPDAIESPAWHEEELRVREAQLASGEAKFVDWETAKDRDSSPTFVTIGSSDSETASGLCLARISVSGHCAPATLTELTAFRNHVPRPRKK